MSNLQITASSRIGCIRSNNEDMILVGGKYVRSDAYSANISTEYTNRFVIALADGMGGHNAGEVASADTLRNLQFYVTDLPNGLDESQLCEAMVEWLVSINQIIDSQGRVNPEMEEMGTTLVGILYYEGKYFWMNCGDSRLYVLRKGKLEQMSTDHSLNTMMGVKRHSNVITNCIGGGCTTSYLDFYEFTDEILSGDVFMLCSDGLSDMVQDDEIEKLLKRGEQAEELCEAAIKNGGFDNVSVCVIKLV